MKDGKIRFLSIENNTMIRKLTSIYLEFIKSNKFCKHVRLRSRRISCVKQLAVQKRRMRKRNGDCLDIDGDELVLQYWTTLGLYMHLLAALESNNGLI